MVSNVKMNFGVLKDVLVSTPIVAQIATLEAQAEVEQRKDILIANLLNHEISREIMAGPDLGGFSADGSKVLPGGYGNLFSFIGFESGRRPIEELKEFLENSITVRPKFSGVLFKAAIIGRRLIGKGRGLDSFLFEVRTPTQEEIEQRTPVAWAGGKGWTRLIEEGINNFSFYYFLSSYHGGSRSGRAFQERYPLRHVGEFTGKKYLSAMLRDFLESCKAPVRIGSVAP